MDVQHTGPIQGLSGCPTSAESRPGRIGPICLEEGERSPPPLPERSIVVERVSVIVVSTPCPTVQARGLALVPALRRISARRAGECREFSVRRHALNHSGILFGQETSQFFSL